MTGIERQQDIDNLLVTSHNNQTTQLRKLGRRSVIKKLAVGTAALAGCGALPDKWTTPLIEFGSLPAHATTSGSIESVLEEIQREIESPAAADVPEASADTTAAAAAPDQESSLSSNEIKIMNTGQRMSWNSYYYDKFVFPKLGPEYTSQPFDLVFSDGNKLHVPNPESKTMTPDNMKYQPGGKYSGNNPDIPTMEVYARKDTHPKWVKAVFRHDI